MRKPSIVAPGGSFDKAIMALHYGADAVYIGAQEFSLRKSANNFTDQEMMQLCKQAHQMKKAVYLALNIFPHERDITPLTQFLKRIAHIPFDAAIVSDIGMACLIRSNTPFTIHASTQASIMNSFSAKLWQDLGAKRIVLAREVSLKEAYKIKQNTGLEIEVFIHGAMCSSFSGKCTISNVASGRDSNRGGCIQSCRHSYQLSNGDSHYLMNSKDLMGIDLIPDYFTNQIDAVKIEGRMKSILYVANACQQYRRAIDLYSSENHLDPLSFKENLHRVSNRGFTSASLKKRAGESSISYDWNGYSKSLAYLGFVKQTNDNKVLIETKQPFNLDDDVFMVTPNNLDLLPVNLNIESINGHRLTQVGANQHVWLHFNAPQYGVLVK